MTFKGGSYCEEDEPEVGMDEWVAEYSVSAVITNSHTGGSLKHLFQYLTVLEVQSMDVTGLK